MSSGSSPETYHIRADFGSSRFTFEINPRDGHAISNIIIDDTTSYKDAYIRLDEKEKILREKCQNKTDESGCDFRQYFLVTFRNNYTNTTTMISDQTCSREWINEENRNFVQYNLLEKDFKNFNELMPIGFSNICDLQVINKEQILSLSKIPFPLKNVKNITYNALLEGKYTFQSHSFSDLTLLLISTQNTS